MSSTPDPPETTGPPENREPSGRERLSASLRRPTSRTQVIAALLLFVLGFASVVQVRANDADDNFTGARQADLIALINSLALATDRAEDEVGDLQRTRDSLRGDAATSQTALSVARGQAETLGILAGTVPVVGPGVRITVETRSGELGTDQLLNGIEELRDAGAEAIEINDRIRVVATTGITESPGGGLTIDGQRVRAPYIIDAIGDPHTLATALDFDGGFVPEVEQVGGTVAIKQSGSIEVSSTVDPPEPLFALPDSEE